MTSRAWLPLLLIVVGAMGWACSKPAKNATSSPSSDSSAEAPATASEQPLAAPPPPKCEALTEKCAAGASGRSLAIGTSGYQLTVAPGWTHAKGPTGVQAVKDGTSLAFAFGQFDGPAPKEEKKKTEARRLNAVTELAGAVGITLPKKPKFAHGDKKPVKDLTLQIFDMDGAERDGKKGVLGVFLAPTKSGSWLVGIGFVAEQDRAESSQILSMVDSIATASATEGSK